MSGLLAVLLAIAAASVAVTSSATERRLHRLQASPRHQPSVEAAGAGSDRALRGRVAGRPVTGPNGPDPGRAPPLGARRRRPRGAERTEGVPVLLTPAGRRLLGGAAGLGLFVVIGGAAGVALGLLAAAGLPAAVARLPDPAKADRLRHIRADLPLALDLMSSCLAAGAPLGAAVGAVAAELRGPLAEVLTDVAGQLALGADPAVAWRRPAALEPLEPVVETVTRVGDSGAALVPALRRLAADERDRRRQEQETAIRRVGVFVVVPLGVCFLPAFLLIGVVPIVAGLIGGLLP